MSITTTDVTGTSTTSGPLPEYSILPETTSPTQKPFEDFAGFQAFIRHMCSEGSGIDPLLFEACVEFHEELEINDGHDASTPIHEELGWNFRRFRHTLSASAPLYAAFFRNEDGSLWQAIVSLWDEEKQRPYSYIAPSDNGDRLFLPPIPPEVRHRIGERYQVEVPQEGSFWEWARCAPIPRIITEGAKKALSALSHGYLTLALYGCTCGAATTTMQGTRVAPYLKSELRAFAYEKSQWLFAFDRDEKPSAIKAVTRGKQRLTSALCDVTCTVEDIIWTPDQGKGIDDVMVLSGSDAFEQSYRQALQRLERQFTAPHLSETSRAPIPKADIIASWLAQDYAEKLLWNDAHKTWMFYELHRPGVWSAVNDHYIETEIQNILKARGIRGYGTDAYISNIRKFVSRELVTFTWDEREGILPFEDGVATIDTGEFEPHSPHNRLTWCLPRKYHTPLVAEWGQIRAWLAEAWPDEKDRDLLLCFAAAAIRGRYDLQKFLYLVGTGGSGKGTYTRLLQQVLGDRNTWAGKIEQLGDKNDCSRLVNKRLAVFADQDKVTGGLQFFKNLTGQDDLTAKRLYKDGFNFIFRGLALITANAPALLGAGSWMKRRAVVVNCTYQPPCERNLDAAFEPEIAAFTRYLLSISNERIDRVLRDGRPTSGAVSAAFWDMAQRQDSIVAWLEESVVFEDGVFTQVGKNKDEWRDNAYTPEMSTLFGSYHHFCRATGLQGKSLNNFAPELEELCQKVLGYKFVRRERNSVGVRGFRGIRLRRDHEARISDSLSSDLESLPDSQTDTPEALSLKHSDNHDNLLEKSGADTQLSCDRSDISPIMPSHTAPPVTVTTSPLTIEVSCQGCQGDAENHGAVKDVASDNHETATLSGEDALGTHTTADKAVLSVSPTPRVPSWVLALRPGSLVMFQHDEVTGWRKGIIEKVVIESGFFVHAVVKATIKKHGQFVERTYTVGWEDWLRPRE